MLIYFPFWLLFFEMQNLQLCSIQSSVHSESLAGYYSVKTLPCVYTLEWLLGSSSSNNRWLPVLLSICQFVFFHKSVFFTQFSLNYSDTSWTSSCIKKKKKSKKEEINPHFLTSFPVWWRSRSMPDAPVVCPPGLAPLLNSVSRRTPEREARSSALSLAIRWRGVCVLKKLVLFRFGDSLRVLVSIGNESQIKREKTTRQPHKVAALLFFLTGGDS